MKTKLTSLQAAYLAAFIDGEGSLECQKQTGKNRVTPAYALRLSFTLATDEPLKTFTQWFPSEVKIYPPTDATRSPRHRMHIPKGIAIQLIRQCLPFMILKTRQAQLILAIESVRASNTPDRTKILPSGSLPMPQEAVKQMEMLFQELRSLKSNKRSMNCRNGH